MRRLLAVIGVSLCLPLMVCSQAARPDPLPASLRAHVANERLEIVTSIRGLPLGVREALQTLFGGYSLDIAEPGADFQGSAGGTAPALPSRRLAAAGCSIDHCLVHYEIAGSERSWRVALFHWTPAETRLEWGGTSRVAFATVDEVRSAMLAGKIEGQTKIW